MADTIRDVVVRLSLEQIDAQVKPPDFTPATTAVEKFEQTSVAAIDELEKEVAKLREEIASTGEGFKQAGSAASSLADIQSAAFSAGEGFRAAGEGAFTLVRGMALVGISGETDLRQFLEQVAKIQGVFDAFKGGFEVTKGLVQGYRQLSAAASALAAAQTTVAGSSVGAAAGIRAVVVALGPLAIALTAAGAAYLLLTRQQEDNTDSLEEQEEAIERIRERTAQELEVLTDRRRSLLDSAEAVKEIREEQEQLTAATEAQDQTISDYAERVEEFQRRFVGNERERARSIELQGEVQIEQEEKRASMLERRIDLELQIARHIASEVKERENALQVAERQLDIEQNRVQSIEETIGRLNESERIELQNLVRRQKEGGLGRAGLSRLEELLPQAREFTGQEFARRERERSGVGAQGLLQGEFGIQPSRTDDLERARDAANTALDEVNRKEEEFQERHIALLDTLTQHLEESIRRIGELEERVVRNAALSQS